MNADLERCNREIAEIYRRTDLPSVPSWLISMGHADWETEKRFIERELMLKAPFPWFGGKSKVATKVWDRFGDVNNYVEPFAGSLAVLLGRPSEAQTETVNDIDCFLANFWRALSIDPEGLTEYADWPVNEADLHARHLWLVNREDFREKMKTDPEFYDVRIAGWWVWGISQWIGSGWCSRPEWTGRTNAGASGRGINRKRPMVHTGKGIHAENPGVASQFHRNATANMRPALGTAGFGINAPTLGKKPRQSPPQAEDGTNRVWRKIPHLGDAGKGISRQLPSLRGDSGAARQGIFAARVAGKRPHLSGRGTGIGIHGDAHSEALYDYMLALASRLRRVRVCCGDWARVTGPSVTVKHGVCGIFLDPPYDMRVVSDGPAGGLYSTHDNDISAEVRKWAIENGGNPLLRIALCGYEGEHDEMPDNWECVHWKAHGGYGSQRGDAGYENAKRERIWFSPHCLKPPSLFDFDEEPAC